MSGAHTVEVITIGDELLLGHTIDTNAAFISRELASQGFRVVARTTVGDVPSAIRDAVAAGLERAEIVICTGGLGPTQDDFTKSVVAELFGTELELDAQLLEQLRERFRRRGITMAERNVCQAEVPKGATVLPNPRGTAPGLALTRADGRCCILLPGVPQEMRGLTMEQVLPFLLQRASGIKPHPIQYHTIRTTGIAESAVAEQVAGLLRALEPLTLAFLPGFAGTDLRITSWGELDEVTADSAINAAAIKIRELLDAHVYGSNDDDLAKVVGDLLRQHRLTVAVAESCTGGLLGKRLTAIPGSSDYFVGGIISYSDRLKQQLLGVRAETLREHGAVSEAVVQEMVRGVQQSTGADCGIAITGIAGPGGGSAEKPVGTVWVACAIDDAVRTRRFVLPGDREEIRERAAQAGLALLWKTLLTENVITKSASTASLVQ
jgi:nicotinamide-nucleotide amidase